MLMQPYVIQEDRKKIPPEKNISNNMLHGTFVAMYISVKRATLVWGLWNGI